jgi:hypothetical protein
MVQSSRARKRSRLAAVLLVLPVLALARRLPAEDLDEEIGKTTDKGIEFFLKAIEAKQVELSGHDGFQAGKMALETYALIVAGVPVDHPLIQKNFASLGKMNIDQTYSLACYAFALDAAMSQIQNDAALASPSQKMRDDANLGAAYRPRLEFCINTLIRIRQQAGGWNYAAGGGRFDNSNTQFAVLGLGVGWKRKVPIPKEVWLSVIDHFLKGQKKSGPEVAERPEFYPEEEKGEAKHDRVVLQDKKTGEKVDPAAAKKKAAAKAAAEKKKAAGGSPTVVMPVRPSPDYGPEKIPYFARGWDYEGKQGETWNMTCGGLSSLILADMALRGQIEPDLQNQINKAIRDGLGWLMKGWNAGGEFYGTYSLEKVADLGEVKKFAAHDWYVEVAQRLLAQQRIDGSWPGGNPSEIRYNSAFALLVLNRATSLITQGKSREGRRATTGVPGGRHDKATSEERNWVYIQKYGLEFHIPTILRQMKTRPVQTLLNILEDAVTEYPEEKKGWLVKNLAEYRDIMRQKPVKDFLESQLVKITGVKYETTAQYLRWCNRWVEVDRIGSEAKDPRNFLPSYHQHTGKSIPLLTKIIWAIGRCRIPAHAPLLFGDLPHAEEDVRRIAYETLGLLKASKEPIPFFEAKADPATRDQQISEVKAWLEKAGVDLAAPIAPPIDPPKLEPKPDAKAEPKPDAKAEPKPDAKADPKPEPPAEPKPEPKAAPQPEPKVEPKPEPKVEPRPEPKPESKPEPKGESKPEAKDGVKK